MKYAVRPRSIPVQEAAPETGKIIHSAPTYSFTAVVGVIAFVFVAILPWWNRFVAVTNEGWHYLYGQQILQGKVPYRDFYLFAPPLLALKNAACIALFGNHLIAPQVLGFLETAVIAIALYLWLSRVFATNDAYLATATGMAIYIFGSTTESLSSLHQEGVLYPVVAGCLASVALRRKSAFWVLLAGFVAGLAALGKQTSGAATTVILGAVIAFVTYRQNSARRALIVVAAYLVGWTVPVLALCTWLFHANALHAFITDTLLSGPSSKGSFSDILLRPFLMVAADIRLQLDVVLAIVVLALAFWLTRRKAPQLLGDDRSAAKLYVLLALTFSAVAIGAFLSRFGGLSHLKPYFRALPSYLPIFIGEIGCLVLFVISARVCLRGRVTDRDGQLLLLSAMGLGLAYSLSLSWVTYISMILPAFPFVLAKVLDRCRFSRQGSKLIPVIISLCMVVIGQLAWSKSQRPYEWGGWTEPNVHTAHFRSRNPQLAGFRMSAGTVDIVDRITREIDDNSRPDQSVFVDPNLALFYVLADRKPATFAFVHYVDVAPDYIDRLDAHELVRHPPRVIVQWQESEQWVRAGEISFRHGRRSGVRDLLSAVDSLKSEYSQIDSINMAGGEKLVVLVRR